MSVRSGILPTEPGEEGGNGAEAELSPGHSPAGAGPRLGGKTGPQPTRGEGEVPAWLMSANNSNTEIQKALGLLGVGRGAGKDGRGTA